MNIQNRWFVFMSARRYARVLREFYEQGDEAGVLRGYKNGYLMGRIEKINTQDDPFVAKLKEAADECERRVSLLNIPKAWTDAFED